MPEWKEPVTVHDSCDWKMYNPARLETSIDREAVLKHIDEAFFGPEYEELWNMNVVTPNAKALLRAIFIKTIDAESISEKEFYMEGAKQAGNAQEVPSHLSRFKRWIKRKISPNSSKSKSLIKMPPFSLTTESHLESGFYTRAASGKIVHSKSGYDLLPRHLYEKARDELMDKSFLEREPTTETVWLPFVVRDALYDLRRGSSAIKDPFQDVGSYPDRDVDTYQETNLDLDSETDHEWDTETDPSLMNEDMRMGEEENR